VRRGRRVVSVGQEKQKSEVKDRKEDEERVIRRVIRLIESEAHKVREREGEGEGEGEGVRGRR
jgi:hypothetical protein